jgi:hypothetical protein
MDYESVKRNTFLYVLLFIGYIEGLMSYLCYLCLLVYGGVFLLCLSSCVSCVPYVASFSELPIFVLPLRSSLMFF